MALKSNENGIFYPIWGTCLGFELLALLANKDEPNLASCWSQDQALPLNFTQEWLNSNISLEIPQKTFDDLATKDLTINFHRWCLTPQNFTHYQMENFWKLLATGHDLNGLGKIQLCEKVSKVNKS